MSAAVCVRSKTRAASVSRAMGIEANTSACRRGPSSTGPGEPADPASVGSFGRDCQPKAKPATTPMTRATAPAITPARMANPRERRRGAACGIVDDRVGLDDGRGVTRRVTGRDRGSDFGALRVGPLEPSEFVECGAALLGRGMRAVGDALQPAYTFVVCAVHDAPSGAIGVTCSRRWLQDAPGRGRAASRWSATSDGFAADSLRSAGRMRSNRACEAANRNGFQFTLKGVPGGCAPERRRRGRATRPYEGVRCRLWSEPSPNPPRRPSAALRAAPC